MEQYASKTENLCLVTTTAQSNKAERALVSQQIRNRRDSSARANIGCKFNRTTTGRHLWHRMPLVTLSANHPHHIAVAP
jgi:hypothetical protein